ncbi:hypothetical protein ABH909_004419 [Pseudomonas sp. BS3782 TE3695]|uniref:hypothetical protein n=1 Tax=Pseudomonas sp. BS3782 TE3695 TaxID=3349323 RepID=UPI003D263A6E
MNNSEQHSTDAFCVIHRIHLVMNAATVGAAEACDLLTFSVCTNAEDQKIAAFGSSYRYCFRRDIAAAQRGFVAR